MLLCFGVICYPALGNLYRGNAIMTYPLPYILVCHLTDYFFLNWSAFHCLAFSVLSKYLFSTFYVPGLW